jgi:hypothetical protein
VVTHIKGGAFIEFENGALRRIFVPKRDEDVGGGRRLHKEELRNLFALPDIIRVI